MKHIKRKNLQLWTSLNLHFRRSTCGRAKHKKTVPGEAVKTQIEADLSKSMRLLKIRSFDCCWRSLIGKTQPLVREHDQDCCRDQNAANYPERPVARRCPVQCLASPLVRRSHQWAEAHRSAQRLSAVPPPQVDGSDRGAAGAVRSIARPHLPWPNPRGDPLRPTDRDPAE